MSYIERNDKDERNESKAIVRYASRSKERERKVNIAETTTLSRNAEVTT